MIELPETSFNCDEVGGDLLTANSSPIQIGMGKYTGSPHIVRFHFVRFTLCATFVKSTLLRLIPHFVREKIAQSEFCTNVHFVRNFTLCDFLKDSKIAQCEGYLYHSSVHQVCTLLNTDFSVQNKLY